MIFRHRDADAAAGRGRWFRSAGLLIAMLLLTGAMEKPKPPPPLPPAEAARQGKALVTDLLARTPTQNGVIAGTLKISDGKGGRVKIPIKFQTVVTPTNWQSIYRADSSRSNTNGSRIVDLEIVRVIHGVGLPNGYETAHVLNIDPGADIDSAACRITALSTNQVMVPFARSDFWLADLGLEFFHWPTQRLLKSEMSRNRSCRVLESTNPNPLSGAYSRVISWVDIESGGIVFAEAYDVNGKLLKEFRPKDFQKVQGQWQLKEMQIDNRQTGSSTRIEFNLD